MIKRLNDFSYKSFRNYSGPDEEFKRVNIVFGYNGRGKSSLTHGVIKAF